MTTDNHDSAIHGSTLRLALRSIDEDRAMAVRAAESQHARHSGALLRDAITRVEALEAELAETRAELDEANDHKPDTLNAAAILHELERRGLWNVGLDDSTAPNYARDVLGKVLDGVAAAGARPIDLGVTTGDSPVEVSVPVPDEEGWYLLGDMLPAIGAATRIDADRTTTHTGYQPVARNVRADCLTWNGVTRWRYADEAARAGEAS